MVTTRGMYSSSHRLLLKENRLKSLSLASEEASACEGSITTSTYSFPNLVHTNFLTLLSGLSQPPPAKVPNGSCYSHRQKAMIAPRMREHRRALIIPRYRVEASLVWHSERESVMEQKFTAHWILLLRQSVNSTPRRLKGNLAPKSRGSAHFSPGGSVKLVLAAIRSPDSTVGRRYSRNLVD